MTNRRIRQILLLIIILAVSVKLVFSYQYYPYFDYYNQKIISLVESFHPYDDVVFIIFQIVQVLIVGAIPAEISGFIGGYLYGPIIGTIYSTLGLAIGSWLAFMLSRTFGLPLVRRLVSEASLEKYDHFMEVRGTPVCFILFLIPGFPKAALCYIIGVSRMNVWSFVAISTLGRLFGTLLLSLSGYSIRTLRIWVLLTVLVIVAVIFLLVYLNRGKLLEITQKQTNSSSTDANHTHGIPE